MQYYLQRTDRSYRTNINRLTHGRVQEALELENPNKYKSPSHQGNITNAFWTRDIRDKRHTGDNESERRVLDVELDSVRTGKTRELAFG
jgi:hypothetical protein